MFAHDLCHSQIEYLRTAIDLNKKIERSDSTNIQFSIFNLQFRLARVGLYSALFGGHSPPYNKEFLKRWG